jgi:hypothetical protein
MLRFGWQVRAGMNRRALHIHDNSHPWLGTDTSLKVLNKLFSFL